jgi:hypothetical protein
MLHMKEVCDVDVGKKSIASFVLIILVIHDVNMVFTSDVKIDHLINRVSERFLGKVLCLFFLSSIFLEINH